MECRNHIMHYRFIHLSGFLWAAVVLLFFCAAPCAIHISRAADIPIKLSITPARIEQGSVARITVICPDSVTALSYAWQDINAALFMDVAGSYFGLVPIAMDQQPGPASLKIILRDSDNTTTVLNTPFEIIVKNFPVQHLTVDESKDTMDQQTLERHNRERAQIENIFAQSQPRRLWIEAFVQPLQGRLSTPFGVKRFINKQPRNPHSGIDIAAPAGTPVKATTSGVVSLTAEHFFAGKSVYIDHGCNIFSMYFHLDTIAVQDGQTVARGDIIGRVGASGRATGPHLHWGMRMYGTPIDPFSLLALFEK